VKDQLSIRDVAELAGISPVTVRQHNRNRTMPRPDGWFVGRPWWWRSTITAWLESRRPPGRPAA